MTLHHPESLDEALALLAEAAPVVLAGGTDVYPGLRDGPPPPAMMDLTRIAGLRGIAHEGGLWHIGAATTWADIAKADLPPLFAGLQAAAREVGSVQIQSTGTVAGNLCNASPAADGVPALLALDAEVRLQSLEAIRQVRLSDFITGVRRTDLQPGELVTAILVPDRKGQGAFLKLGARRYLVISIAMVSAVVEAEAGVITRAALAVGACSPVAARLPALEVALLGCDAAQAAEVIAGAALPELTPIDDVRAPAAYRLDAARTLLTRAVTQALEVSHVA